MRAVQDALPVMGLYDAVTVLSVKIPEEDADIELQSKLIEHLARHGLNAMPRQPEPHRGLLPMPVDRASNWMPRAIIMGTSGHSRLRKTILGGVTRDMLLDTSRPLLMSH